MSVGAVNKETGERIPTAGMPAIDSVLSGTSTNPVQNRVVKAALDDKADTDIVASDFSAAVSYTAGEYCIYDGKFYKFKATHSGAWSVADVDEIKIAGELSSLMSGLTGLAATHLPFQRDSVNKVSYTFNVSPNKSHSFRAGIVIQHNDTNPSIHLLYMGVGSTATVNIGKVFGNSDVIALSSASIDDNVLTITFAREAYGGCSLIWLN